MSGTALFGKLPAHGDFITRGLFGNQRERLDTWLSASLDDARTHLGDAFAERFDCALPWCCSGAGMTGAVAASQDSLGRRFPVLLMLGDPDAAARCERLLYAAIGDRWEADRLIAEAGDAPGAPVVDGADLWWRSDAPPDAAALNGAFPPALMAAMLAPREAS